MNDQELNPKRCVEDMKDHPWERRCSFFLHDELYQGILRMCTCSGAPVPLSLSEMSHTSKRGCGSFRSKRVVIENPPQEATG